MTGAGARRSSRVHTRHPLPLTAWVHADTGYPAGVGTAREQVPPAAETACPAPATRPEPTQQGRGSPATSQPTQRASPDRTLPHSGLSLRICAVGAGTADTKVLHVSGDQPLHGLHHQPAPPPPKTCPGPGDARASAGRNQNPCRETKREGWCGGDGGAGEMTNVSSVPGNATICSRFTPGDLRPRPPALRSISCLSLTSFFHPRRPPHPHSACILHHPPRAVCFLQRYMDTPVPAPLLVNFFCC